MVGMGNEVAKNAERMCVCVVTDAAELGILCDRMECEHASLGADIFCSFREVAFLAPLPGWSIMDVEKYSTWSSFTQMVRTNAEIRISLKCSERSKCERETCGQDESTRCRILFASVVCAQIVGIYVPGLRYRTKLRVMNGFMICDVGISYGMGIKTIKSLSLRCDVIVSKVGVIIGDG